MGRIVVYAGIAIILSGALISFLISGDMGPKLVLLGFLVFFIGVIMGLMKRAMRGDRWPKSRGRG